jgi:hypothetical protein
MSILQQIVSTIQTTLFPALESALAAPLGEKGELFVSVVELVRPERFTGALEWAGRGRPRHWRLALLLGFIAKAVWNLPTTRALCDRLAHDPTLRRLCGWERADDVPSEATFSRAFAELARGDLAQRLHEALCREQLADKLWGHASTDATAIVGREKPAPQVKPAAPEAGAQPEEAKPEAPSAPRRKARRGRPRKGEPRPEQPPLKRLALQPGRTLAQNLADLPTACDRGGKRSSKGAARYWTGYKLHLTTLDGQIPVAAILSSASMHDSQAAIPLLQLTRARVTVLYDLMDSAYDAAPIHAVSIMSGHIPIIDPAGRGRQTVPPPPLAPARAIRYRERTAAERVNSDLLDNHGGRVVRVRGPRKVMAHLMLGVLVVAVKGVLGLLT